MDLRYFSLSAPLSRPHLPLRHSATFRLPVFLFKNSNKKILTASKAFRGNRTEWAGLGTQQFSRKNFSVVCLCRRVNKEIEIIFDFESNTGNCFCYYYYSLYLLRVVSDWRVCRVFHFGPEKHHMIGDIHQQQRLHTKPEHFALLEKHCKYWRFRLHAVLHLTELSFFLAGSLC